MEELNSESKEKIKHLITQTREAHKNPKLSLEDKFWHLLCCFKEVLQIVINEKNRDIFVLAKQVDNPFQTVFEKAYERRNERSDFFYYLKRLREKEITLDSPESNVILSFAKEDSLEDFLDLVRHIDNAGFISVQIKDEGDEEPTLLFLLENFLFILIEDAYQVIFRKEISEEKRRELLGNKHNKSIAVSFGDFLGTSTILLLIFGLMFLYLFSWTFMDVTEPGGQYENCDWQYVQDNLKCY